MLLPLLTSLALAGRGAYAPPPPACPEPEPDLPGAFQLTGIAAENVAVWVDGVPVAPTAVGFVATGLAPGKHDVRVATGTRTLYAGPMRIYEELVRRCVPAGTGLECVHVETIEAIAPVAPPVPPAPPVVRTPAPPAPTAMADADFTGLLTAIRGEAFSSDKLTLVGNAARGGYFTIAQVGRVLDELAHSSDKVEAARLLAPRVLDRQNAHALNAHLTFSSDKEAVQALFR